MNTAKGSYLPKPVTVADLIAFLEKQPKDMVVAYKAYSENNLLGLDMIKTIDGRSEGSMLSLDMIKTIEACAPRPDGWVPNARPDRQAFKYLLLPGN